MKIVFYSTDSKIQHFYSTLEVEGAHLCTSPEEIVSLFSDGDQSLVILDFDCEELKPREILGELKSLNNVSTVLLSGAMELAEIVEFQNSQEACDSYLTKPLTVEVLTSVVNDLEIDSYQKENPTVSPEDAKRNAHLTFIGLKTDDLQEKLDSLEVEEDDEDEVDFSANEFKIASEVRDVLNEHNQELDFDDEINQEIQRKFDTVFGVEEKPKVKENNEINISAPVEESVEEISVDFSTEQDSGIEVEIQEDNASSSKELSMSDDNDEIGGLEFNLPEEGDSNSEEIEFGVSESNEEAKEEKTEAPAEISTDEADSGLEFNLGELEDNDDEVEAAPASEAEEIGGLDLGEDGAALDLSAEGDEVEAAPAEEAEEIGGLDLGEDGAALDLSAEGDELEAAPVVEEEVGGLDLGDDGGSLDLSGEGDVIDNAPVEEEDPLAESSIDALKADNTSDIDATINSIVQGPEDATGEFDMAQAAEEDGTSTAEIETASATISEEGENLQEFDYKTSSGFAPALDEIAAADIGEDTNPTIIAQTSTLQEFKPNEDTIDEDPATVTSSLESDLNQLAQDEPTGETVLTSDLNFSNVAPEGDETKTVSTSPMAASNLGSNAPAEDFVPRNYDEDEMLRLQGTIRQLREEREGLMDQINSLKAEKQLLEQDNLGLKAELDEVKIELGIIKKRSHDEVSEMSYQVKVSDEKKEFYETKAKNLQKEFDRLNQKVRIDFNQVKQREKELESKLELAVMDSESQVQSRDMKILELKRKIDALEFNMENSSIREQKFRDDKSKLEERLSKIMKTLRGSIQLIEDDLDDLENEAPNELDKN